MKRHKGILFTDGGARGNPGPAAIGGVLFIDGSTKEQASFSQSIGSTTNNVAEYQALIYGLRLAHTSGCGDIECRLDSELVVRQVRGEYKVKDTTLRILHGTVMGLLVHFERFSISHIPREHNKNADRLVNRALDA